MSSFPAEQIAQIGSFPITNTLLHTLLVDGVLIAITIFATKNIKKIPTGFQNIVEYAIESYYNLTESIAPKTALYIFPFVMSFFLFIVVANFTALLPGVGTIGFFKHAPAVAESHNTHGTEPEIKQTGHASGKEEFVPILRGPTSDINVTLALAVISVFATHVLSIKLTGIKDYLGRYFSLNPINLYVGLLELVAEVTKVVSLSFRLFGNIFAGEVALATVSKIFAFLFPLPFLLLESIVAVVQALVFSMLTLVFMAILTTPHHAHEEAHH